MRRLGIPTLFAILLALAAPRAGLTCPTCADAVPSDSGLEEQDQARLSRAYNNSIYLMIVVPYGSLALVGAMVYRHLRVRAALQQRLLEDHRPGVSGNDPSPPSGDLSCSAPSPDDVS